MEPLVSVVIPTYRRPQLVQRAVRSALAQTLSQIEVIVVIDGPDETTRAVLDPICDPRLKVLELPTNQGCSPARNAGVVVAQGEWIAHLDDDDEWMPQKLELQLEAARHSKYKFPIVSCFLISRTPNQDEIWPRRVPQPSEPVSEYLFVRHTFFQGEGLIQASTIFTSKELLQKVICSSQYHEDWDWLLRASAVEGVGIEFVPQPLSIWYGSGQLSRLSSAGAWQESFDWIREQRNLVTPRAYSSFILAEVSSRAALVREWKAFFPLLWEAIRRGAPQPGDIGLYLGMWLIPPQTRRWLRGMLARKAKLFSSDYGQAAHQL